MSSKRGEMVLVETLERVEEGWIMSSLTSRPGWIMNGDFPPPDESSPPKEAGTGNVQGASRYACFGGFCLDLAKHELTKDGVRVKMQGKVCEVLLILMETPGEVVTREALRMRLWPPDSRVNYDANVNTTVNKLRQVLGDSSEQSSFVETIPRKGYSFIAPVEYTNYAPGGARGQKTTSQTSAVAGAAPAEGRMELAKSAMSSIWFKAGVIALLIAAMLFGAALMLFTRH
jgi:DNA-binding winged helix-turn-helix (wHTH) protein